MIGSHDETSNEDRPRIFSKKAVAAIVVIAICIAASVVGFFVLGFGKSLINKVEDAVVKTAGALSGKSEVLDFVYSLTDSKSPGVSICAENIGEMISGITGDPSAASDLDADLKLNSAVDRKGNSFVTARILSNGDEAVAGLYKSSSGDADAALVMPGIIDDVYGFSINSMKKDLEDSILAPGSGSKYSLNASDFEQISGAVDLIQTLNQYFSADDLKELAAVIMESDETRVDFKFGKEEASVGGERLQVNAYKVTLTTGTLKGTLDAAARWLDRNYKLFALDMTFEEALETITDNILENELELNLEFDVYNGYLVRLLGSIGSFEFSVDLGPEPEKTEVISAVISKNGDDVFYDIDISELEKNELSISAYSSSEDVISAKLSYDDAENRFRIKYDNGGTSAEITGDMTLAEGALTISDPEINDNGHVFDLNGFSAELTNSAGMRKLSDDFPDGYINIFTIDEKDADSALGNVFEAGQVLYDVIGVDFYNILLSIADLFR